MESVNEIISYLPAAQNPLSADVITVKGKEITWFFDVGSNDASLRLVQNTQGEKGIVISHFHPDHMANLKRMDLDDPEITLFVGENTYKYIQKGIIVSEAMRIEDGCSIHIFPLPSSHAKGSLGLEVDNSCAFLGDGAYPASKNGKQVYNAQLLREEIKILETLQAKEIFLSHQMSTPIEKDKLLQQLSAVYEKREKSQAFIYLD